VEQSRENAENAGFLWKEGRKSHFFDDGRAFQPQITAALTIDRAQKRIGCKPLSLYDGAI
jgi:hypothetical protein